MTTFVTCKNCKNNIEVVRSQGNVQIKGNVTYNGVRFEGSSIIFGQGGGINFSDGGSVSFGTDPKSRITCSICGRTFDYSTTDFQEDV
jgi:hypothetical protein